MVVELNRRLVKGYAHFKDDPRIANLRNSIVSYNKRLRILGIRDHQVAYAKFSIIQVIATLICRLGKLVLLTIGTLPGLILFAPVFVATKYLSIKKSHDIYQLTSGALMYDMRPQDAHWGRLAFLVRSFSLYSPIIMRL